ncbi:HIT domain-containing protein [Candidatus Dojkabacteria bacterium]|nr:HIT domain-containing protein [Candidatus Dojkabacteria bacterium]
MSNHDCIFCKIVKGEIPSYKVYEDDDFMAILDAFPAYKGHSLIIPKKHYQDIFDMPEDLAGKAMQIGKKIATAMENSLDADGYNFVQNNREFSGQVVMHYHLHVIPRYKDMSEPGVEYALHGKKRYEPSDKEKKETAEVIKNASQII